MGDDKDESEAAIPASIAKADLKWTTAANWVTITVESIRALAKVAKAVAWPAAVLLLAGMFVANYPAIFKTVVDDLLTLQEKNKHMAIGVGAFTYSSDQMETAALVAVNVSRQMSPSNNEGKKVSSPTKEETKAIAQLAAAAVVTTSSGGALASKKKLLWVDDHPQNNSDLQAAFEELGIKVVDVKSDSEISAAFAREGGFSIVITDMKRDNPLDLTAGLKTVALIAQEHPNVPVIIYSGEYAAAHASDPPKPPVIAITNVPGELFRLVTTSNKISAGGSGST